MRIENISLSFGARVLFTDINLDLNKGQRYGLVGANGAGKTTFLKIINGEIAPDTGNIRVSKNEKVCTLKQDHFIYEKVKLVDVVIQGNEILWDSLQEKEKILAQTEITLEDGMRLAELEEAILHADGYAADGEARTLLLGLGIPEEKHDSPMHALSGGLKLRVLLAQLLFQKPDVLLLDEPTNHLDIVSIAWLEKYLCNEFKGVLLCISHDRSFLNRIVTDILDVDYQTITVYPGNYDNFIAKKFQSEEQAKSLRANQEKKVEHLQAFADKFRAKASKARQAQSKLKQIEKIELTEIKSSSRITPNFAFVQEKKSGKIVIEAKQITKAYDLPVLRDISFHVQQSERVAFIGANGVGKSTLLKILVGEINADNGEYEWSGQVKFSYFDQSHKLLQGYKGSVLEWLTEQFPEKDNKSIRQALGRALFSGDDAKQLVSALSGGEQARLLFAKIMLEKANVLVLDEPTNHLDIEAIEALAKALQHYLGTVLFVSHDRFFVSEVASRIVEIKDKHINDFHGSYADFAKKFIDVELAISAKKFKEKSSPKTEVKITTKPKNIKKLAMIEEEIAKLELKEQEILSSLANPFCYTEEGKAKYNQLQNMLKACKKELDGNLAKWEDLQE